MRSSSPASSCAPERHDRTRPTGATATVDRQALIHLLMDHARMPEALRNRGEVEIKEPDS